MSERWRPAYHFSPTDGFMNDPNGLLWHGGSFHLFFQHSPGGPVLGGMDWGHATSPDLVRWTVQPTAIHHDDEEDVWSGSAVVDVGGTAGFGEGALVAVYTSRRAGSRSQSQSLAWSTDDGQTWTKHDGNPVLDIGSPDFRDPKVWWDARRRRWVMVVALPEEHRVSIYTSPDLRTWTHRSDTEDFGLTHGVWECPDLFPVALGRRRPWVLVVSVGPRVHYVVGEFDGERFIATTPARVLDHGPDFYAAVTWNSAPDQRRLAIGWLGSWEYAEQTPTEGWRGAQSVVRELTLREVAGMPTLQQRPVDLTPVGVDRTRLGAHRLEGEQEVAFRGTSYQLDLVVHPQDATLVGVDVLVGPGPDGEQVRTRVAHDVERGVLFLDRRGSGETGFAEGFAAVHEAPLDLGTRALELTVLVDACSVEVFAGAGSVALSSLVFPTEGAEGLRLVAEGGAARVERVDVSRLGPAVERG